MHKKIAYTFLIFICLIYNAIYCEELIKGNNDSISSFNFNIGTHAFYIFQSRFFVGAGQENISKEFAVSAIFRNQKQFKPLAPEKVNLNNQPDQENPLYNSAISKMTTFGMHVLVSQKGDPSSIYLVDDIRPEIIVTAAFDIANSQGKKAKEILAIASQSLFNSENTQIEEAVGAFVALSNEQGGFDGNGSSIAYIGLNKSRENDEKVSKNFEIFNAQEGGPGNLAAPISKNTAAIFINNPVNIINNVVDMHWDAQLSRLYIALQVQANSEMTDGARAILVASVNNGKLEFQSIAPDGVFDNSNQIVGAIGSDIAISLTKVRTILTSTNLKYLIVANSDNKIFSLPLIDLPGSSSNGTLANVNKLPIDQVVSTSPFRFQARRFTEPAEVIGDAFNQNSIPALVGGNSILQGQITDIYTFKDSVFVSCNSGGIFFSQAIFDEFGRIKGWTQWAKANTNSANGFALDIITSNLIYMPIKDGANSNTVVETVWSNGEGSFDKLISNEFPEKNSGVQGIFDFPSGLPNFNSQFSMLVMTGFDKVMLLQTSPVFDVSQIFKSNNGSLQDFNNSNTIITISGGALGSIGSITSAEIVTDGTYSWLVVGGKNGLAILTKPDGTSWLNNPGLGSGFSGLTSDMSFIPLNKFNFVRKLVSINNRLFVLTPYSLTRLEINSSNLINNNVVSTVLAVSSDLAPNASFTDVIISGPLAILASSIGLFRSGNQVDVNFAIEKSASKWTPIILPESSGYLNGLAPIVKFLAISPTSYEKDVLTNSSGISQNPFSGNLYVLNAYVGYHQAQTYRLALDFSGIVNDNTVKLFPDIFTNNLRTYYNSFGTYRNSIYYDGALFFATRNAYNGNRPFASILPPSLRGGQIERYALTTEIPLNINNNHSIVRLLRANSLGNYLIAGDFGIRINS